MRKVNKPLFHNLFPFSVPTRYEELVRLNDQSKEFNDRILEQVEELGKKMDTQRVKLAFDKGESSLTRFAMKQQDKHKKTHRFNRTELALGSIPECSVYHLLPSMQTAELIKPASASRCNSAFFTTRDGGEDDNSAHVDENTTEITEFTFQQNDEEDDYFVQETERSNDGTHEPPATNRSNVNDPHQPEDIVADNTTKVTIHAPPGSGE